MLCFVEPALQFVPIDLGNPLPELAGIDFALGLTGHLFESYRDRLGVDGIADFADRVSEAAQQPFGIEVTLGTGDHVLRARRHLIQFAAFRIAHRPVLLCDVQDCREETMWAFQHKCTTRGFPFTALLSAASALPSVRQWAPGPRCR